MKFLNIYKENRKSVIDALKQMWCSETANESQRAYAKRIEKTAVYPTKYAGCAAVDSFSEYFTVQIVKLKRLQKNEQKVTLL